VSRIGGTLHEKGDKREKVSRAEPFGGGRKKGRSNAYIFQNRQASSAVGLAGGLDEGAGDGRGSASTMGRDEKKIWNVTLRGNTNHRTRYKEESSDHVGFEGETYPPAQRAEGRGKGIVPNRFQEFPESRRRN